MPTAAERQGDFSDLLPATQLIDPPTGALTQTTRFPGDRLSPVANYLLPHVPLPNGRAPVSFNGAPLVQNTDEYLVKIDYNLGKHHISGHYFQINYSVPIVTPPTDNILEINTNPAASIQLKNISVVDIYTISPTFLLNSYFGYTRQNGLSLSNIPFNMADAGVNIAQPASLPGGKGPGMDVDVSGGLTISGSHYGEFDRGDQSLREIGTLIRGKNAIQFGGEFLRITRAHGQSV